jgi:hypothetical protein
LSKVVPRGIIKAWKRFRFLGIGNLFQIKISPVTGKGGKKMRIFIKNENDGFYVETVKKYNAYTIRHYTETGVFLEILGKHRFALEKKGEFLGGYDTLGKAVMAMKIAMKAEIDNLM